MINWDIEDFARRNWAELRASVSRLSSRRDSRASSLVENDRLFYDFDAICRSTFGEKSPKLPKSADALCIGEKAVELVEFKSGFSPSTPKDNAGDMPAGVLEKKREKEKSQRRELRESLKLKAAESYVFLEKHVGCHPDCKSLNCGIALNLAIVIDYEPVRDTVKTLEDAATAPTSIEAGKLAKPVEDKDLKAVKKSLKQALQRFHGQAGADGKPYYYDSVSIRSAQEYAADLERRPE